MIAKSYEIKNRISNFLKYNLFLFYGENDGLKKDIVESIKSEVKIKNPNIEFSSLYESNINDNKESFYNSIYSSKSIVNSWPEKIST